MQKNKFRQGYTRNTPLHIYDPVFFSVDSKKRLLHPFDSNTDTSNEVLKQKSCVFDPVNPVKSQKSSLSMENLLP